jgi:hypothetical protein
MFNEKTHQINLKPLVDKLAKDLKRDNITLDLEGSKFNNIIFKQGTKQIEMAKWSFYRCSGMMNLHVHKEKIIEIIPFSIEDWLFKIIKPIIVTRLNKTK